MKLVLPLILLALILSAGCSDPVSPLQARTDPSELPAATWILATMTGEDGASVQVAPYRVVLRFDSVRFISGRGPVNSYYGVFHATATGGMIIDSLVTTAVFGSGLDLEDRYLDALHMTNRFETGDGKLRMYFPGSGVLEYNAE